MMFPKRWITAVLLMASPNRRLSVGFVYGANPMVESTCGDS